jgi:indole-3-glycerol phosphate synthase
MLLSKIIKKRNLEISNHSYLYDVAELVENLQPVKKAASFYDQMAKPGIAAIGLIQRSVAYAPNRLSDEEVARIAKTFSGCMDAISILTEGLYHNGDVDDIQRCRELTSLPIMQNDILVSPLHVFHAKKLGASAVLYVSCALNQGELEDFIKITHGLTMDPIVLVDKKEDVSKALKAGARMLAINNRELRSGRFNSEKIKYLGGFIPPDVLRVGIGAVHSKSELESLKGCELNGVFIDPRLMERVPDFRKVLNSL